MEIPSERIPPIATEAASGARTVAIVLGFITILVTIIAFTMENTAVDSAERAGFNVGRAFWPLVFGLIAFRFVRITKRATAAAALALSDPSSRWHLNDKLLLGTDRNGVPNPDVSVKLNEKLRAMLVAVPPSRTVGGDR